MIMTDQNLGPWSMNFMEKSALTEIELMLDLYLMQLGFSALATVEGCTLDFEV